MASGLTSAAVEAVSVFTAKAADTIVGMLNASPILAYRDVSNSGNAKIGDPQKTSSKVKRVAAAVVISAAEIYEGMVEAAIVVSQKTADAAGEVITHKWRQPNST